MGNLSSFCCKESASDNDDRDERSHILNNDNHQEAWDDVYNSSASAISQHQDSPSYGSVDTSKMSKLEQSALDKIIQKMASNVIDVAPVEPLILQPGEISERQKAYKAKLNQIKTPLPLKSIKSSKPSNNSSYDNISNLVNTTADGSRVASPSTVFNNIQAHNIHSTPNKSSELQINYDPIPSDEIQMISQISLRSSQAVQNGLNLGSGDQVVVPMSDSITPNE